MKTIKVSPPYKPLTQQKLCCLPCAIQWVLLRGGLKWVDQEDIATALDLAVPKKFKHLFVKKVKTTKNPQRYGTRTFTKKDRHIQKLFAKYKIPLKVERFLISEIKNPAEFVKKNVGRGNDVILDFHHYGLSKDRSKSKNIGHAVLITEIKMAKDPVVVLGDPSQISAKFWEIKLSKLVKAMDKKYDGEERGFWIVSKVNK